MLKSYRRVHLLILTGLLIAAFMFTPHTSHADDNALCPGSSAMNCNDVPDIDSVDHTTLTAEMNADPMPLYANLPIDKKIIYGRAYRRVLQETDIYDAPNGNAVGHIAPGLNFVNGGKAKDGWVLIGKNQWVPENAVGPVNGTVSKFSGVLLPDGLPEHALGWIITATQTSKTPGAEAEQSAPILNRYTLVHLFAFKTIDNWNWYLIAPDQWVREEKIARVRPVNRPAEITGKWFAVDLYEQTLTAYDDDKAVFTTLISSGLPQTPTTEGLLKIWDRQEIVTMTGGVGQPDYYNLPGVRWALYFNKHDQSIHGAYWHDRFGFRRSHGCVNLSMTDANWAFNWSKDALDAYAFIFHSSTYR